MNKIILKKLFSCDAKGHATLITRLVVHLVLAFGNMTVVPPPVVPGRPRSVGVDVLERFIDTV